MGKGHVMQGMGGTWISDFRILTGESHDEMCISIRYFGLLCGSLVGPERRTLRWVKMVVAWTRVMAVAGRSGQVLGIFFRRILELRKSRGVRAILLFSLV